MIFSVAGVLPSARAIRSNVTGCGQTRCKDFHSPVPNKLEELML